MELGYNTLDKNKWLTLAPPASYRLAAVHPPCVSLTQLRRKNGMIYKYAPQRVALDPKLTKMNRKQRRAARRQTVREHRAGLLAEAAASYRVAVSLEPNRPEIDNDLGLVLHGLGQFDDAVAVYRQAIAHTPQR